MLPGLSRNLTDSSGAIGLIVVVTILGSSNNTSNSRGNRKDRKADTCATADSGVVTLDLLDSRGRERGGHRNGDGQSRHSDERKRRHSCRNSLELHVIYSLKNLAASNLRLSRNDITGSCPIPSGHNVAYIARRRPANPANQKLFRLCEFLEKQSA